MVSTHSIFQVTQHVRNHLFLLYSIQKVDLTQNIESTQNLVSNLRKEHITNESCLQTIDKMCQSLDETVLQISIVPKRQRFHHYKVHRGRLNSCSQIYRASSFLYEATPTFIRWDQSFSIGPPLWSLRYLMSLIPFFTQPRLCKISRSKSWKSNWNFSLSPLNWRRKPKRCDGINPLRYFCRERSEL